MLWGTICGLAKLRALVVEIACHSHVQLLLCKHKVLLLLLVGRSGTSALHDDVMI